MRRSFFSDFSNYGSYDLKTDDGITQWHPAFLELETALDECAKDDNFANSTSRKQNQPASLIGEVSCWLVYTTKLAQRIRENPHARQLTLPPSLTLTQCQVSECPEVMEVAFKFIQANKIPSN